MNNNQGSYNQNRSQKTSSYEDAGYNKESAQEYGQGYRNAGNSYADRQQQSQSYGEQNAGYGRYENRDSRTANRNNNQYGNSGYDQNRLDQNSYSESSYSRPNGYDNDDYRNSGYRQDEYHTANDNHNYNRDSYNNRNNDQSRSSRGYDNDRGFWDKATDEVTSWFGDDDAKRRRQADERSNEGYHSNAHGDSYGGHRGKGPKSYKRSDDRIKEDLNDRLSDDHHIDASHVEVVVSTGDVTLSGYVDSKFAKRHAEDLAEAVSGVSNVENRIRVQGDSENAMTVSDLDSKDSKTGTVNTNSSGKSKQVS